MDGAAKDDTQDTAETGGAAANVDVDAAANVDAAAAKKYIPANKDEHFENDKPKPGIIFYEKNATGDGPKDDPPVEVAEPDINKMGDYVVEDTTAGSSSDSGDSTTASPSLANPLVVKRIASVLAKEGVDMKTLAEEAAKNAEGTSVQVEADKTLNPKKGGRRRTKRKGRKGSKKSKKGAKKSKKSSQSQNGGRRSRRNRRKQSRRSKH
jgi:hypothetical protein